MPATHVRFGAGQCVRFMLRRLQLQLSAAPLRTPQLLSLCSHLTEERPVAPDLVCPVRLR